MKWTHLSTWDQEEYVLGQRTPEMVRHLAQCSACFAEVERMERGIALFRESANVWSAETLISRPATTSAAAPRHSAIHSWAWAMATLLFLIALLPFAYKRTHPVHQQAAQIAAPISDDALLQQVDEEVSVEVPSSMEPLTHLVSTSNNSAATAAPITGDKRRAQRD
jgi:anti-sigma factor RsiW